MSRPSAGSVQVTRGKRRRTGTRRARASARWRRRTRRVGGEPLQGRPERGAVAAGVGQCGGERTGGRAAGPDVRRDRGDGVGEPDALEVGAAACVGERGGEGPGAPTADRLDGGGGRAARADHETQQVEHLGQVVGHLGRRALGRAAPSRPLEHDRQGRGDETDPRRQRGCPDDEEDHACADGLGDRRLHASRGTGPADDPSSGRDGRAPRRPRTRRKAGTVRVGAPARARRRGGAPHTRAATAAARTPADAGVTPHPHA